MSKNTRCGLPAVSSNFYPRVIEGVSENIEDQRLKSKSYYDRFTKDQPQLNVGQEVMVQIRPDRNRHWSRGTIQKQITDRSYIVDVDNTPYRRDRLHLKSAQPLVAEPSVLPEHDQSDFEEDCNGFEEETFSTPIAEQDYVSQPSVRPQRLRTVPKRLIDYDLN